MLDGANTTAAVLAGGLSRRMGSDKALLPLQGSPFIQRITNALTAACPRVIVIADDAEPYAFLQRPIYPDIYHRCGPLAGIHSALVHATTSHVLICSCDLPLITGDVAMALLRDAEAQTITLAADGIRVQPLFGIYPKYLSGELEKALEADTRSVFHFLETQQVRVLDFSAYADHLRNINTPADYRLSLKETGN